MKPYCLPRQDDDLHAQSVLRVLPLGFVETDMEKLKRIFQHLPQGERCYSLIRPSPGECFDILLVNYDNPAALQEQEAILKNQPNIRKIAVSRGPLEVAVDYHIRGLLIAARVMAILERVPMPEVSAVFPPRVEPVRPRPAAPVSSPGYRALVVDDSAAIRKSLELNLIGLEHIAAVEFADSGEAALEKAVATRYDLIFLDIMMPGIDGYETCSRLRTLTGYKRTPIIMVSGKTSPMDEVRGIMAGCTTYLAKPVQPEAFQKLGRRVLAWLAEYHGGGKS